FERQVVGEVADGAAGAPVVDGDPERLPALGLEGIVEQRLERLLVELDPVGREELGEQLALVLEIVVEDVPELLAGHAPGRGDAADGGHEYRQREQDREMRQAEAHSATSL